MQSEWGSALPSGIKNSPALKQRKELPWWGVLFQVPVRHSEIQWKMKSSLSNTSVSLKVYLMLKHCAVIYYTRDLKTVESYHSSDYFILCWANNRTKTFTLPARNVCLHKFDWPTKCLIGQHSALCCDIHRDPHWVNTVVPFKWISGLRFLDSRADRA